MEEESKSYPTWINIILVLSGIIGIFREIPRIINNLMVTEVWYALIVGALSIFASICLICIANRKLWAFYAWILSAILVNLCMWLEPNISTEDCAVHMCAMIVHIFFLLILVFVPFKKGHSLYEAMEPFDLPLKCWLNKMHHYYMKLCIIYRKSKIGSRVASKKKKHFSEKLDEVEQVIYNPSLPSDEYSTAVRKDDSTEKSHYRINLDKITVKHSSQINTTTDKTDYSDRNKKSKRWGFMFLLLFILTLVSTCYYIYNISTAESLRDTYFIDRDSVLHCSEDCRQIIMPSKIVQLEDVISSSITVSNVIATNSNLNLCRDCFGERQMKLLTDSVNSYQSIYWATSDREYIKEKIRRVEYITNHILDKDSIQHYWCWNTSLDEGFSYLRNYENFVSIYIRYYADRYNIDEFTSLYFPGGTKEVDNDLRVAIAHRKLLYDWMLNSFNDNPTFEQFVINASETGIYYELWKYFDVYEFEYCDKDCLGEWLGCTPWDKTVN